MQTLFIKLKKIEKQNNILINTFFINFIIITILLMNNVDLEGFNFFLIKIFPSISIELVLTLLGVFIVSEVVLIRKINKNNQKIQNIKKECQKLKDKEKNIKISKEQIKSYITNYQFNNNLHKKDLTDEFVLSNEKEIAKIKVKKLSN